MWYTVAVGKKRKTREQKIISELRRKLSLKDSDLPEKKEIQVKFQPKAINPPSISFPISSSAGNTASISVKNDYSYVFRDLKRASLFIGLAILLQGVLYLALR